MKGRQIIDDILIASECVDGIKREKRSGLACNIDMAKAYDRVDWNFLKWVLHKKGFRGRWIRWIMGYFDHPHFSIMINGASKGFTALLWTPARRPSLSFSIHSGG